MPVTNPLSNGYTPEQRVRDKDDTVSNEEKIRQVLEEEPDLLPEDYPILGAQALKLLKAQINGKVNLKPGQTALLGSMFRQLVPSAGKMERESTGIRPEVYIKEAMAGNEDSFKKLRERALEYGRQVEERSKEFYRELEAKL